MMRFLVGLRKDSVRACGNEARKAFSSLSPFVSLERRSPPIERFKLERWFADYEFEAPHQLCNSDCEAISQMDLLHVADEECRTLWNDLSLAYTQVKGHPALLEEIAAHYETDAIAPNHIQTLAPEEGIYTAMRVLLRPGDTIVATWPGYQSLMSVALAIGARVVPWPVREDSENGRFYFDVDDLKDIVQRERPQGCVVNFPHNPTGALPTLKEWQHIGDIVEDSGAWIFRYAISFGGFS